MLVCAAAQVAGIGPLIRVQVHGTSLHADVGGGGGGGGGGQMLSWAVVGCKLISRGETFAAAITFKVHLSSRALRAFAEAGCSVGGQLPLGAETLSTLLAVVLLLGKVETQVVFHGQPVGVCGVANIAVVLPNFVKVLVICQAASMTVCLSTFFTRKGPSPTFGWVKLLGSGGSSRRVGLLETLMAVLHAHHMAL